MRGVVWCLLGAMSACKTDFQREIEDAFVRFDANNNGLVTEEQIMEAVEKDIEGQEYEEMEKVVRKMMSEFDLNGDGLDFAELYRASGGNSEDL